MDQTTTRASARKIDACKFYKAIDGPFFLDYGLFAGGLRVMPATLIAEQALCRKNQAGDRRLLVLESLFLFHLSLEDAAAFIDAMAKYRTGELVNPVEHLMTYGVGEARLDKVLRRHRVRNGEDLFTTLAGSDLCQGEPSDGADLSLAEPALQKWCRFVVEDATRNENAPFGHRAYNKLKHGPIAVGSASAFLTSGTDSPALIYESSSGDPKPYTFQSFERWGKKEVEKLCKAVGSIHGGLRLIALLYVRERYSDLWSERIAEVKTAIASKRRWGEIGALIDDASGQGR